jgi:hypothetical protein
MKHPVIISAPLWLLLLWTGFSVYASVEQLSQPPASWRVGSGKLTWLGLTVYQATLYAPQGEYRADLPHAIRIDYRFSFDRRQLAHSSLQEIEKLFGRRQDGEQVVQRLASVFCDVAKGDHILGIHYPGRWAEFHCNGELLGRIEDAALARAFFAIWLNPRTSEPELRDQLLGYQS